MMSDIFNIFSIDWWMDENNNALQMTDSVLFLLLAIVLRCIQVGMKSPDYMNRLICIGIASMLLFQILINVGVCLGLFPVVGLALPFLSYGGSSILTSFLAMGIVSGINMRPAPDSSARYIRPPLSA